MRKASIIRFPQREVAKYRSDGMRDLIRGGVLLVQHNKGFLEPSRFPCHRRSVCLMDAQALTLRSLVLFVLLFFDSFFWPPN